MIKQSDSIQLHYYFSDDSHSINSTFRNECEKELLSFFKDISASLNVSVELETLPSQEGGFKEVWKFIGKNGTQLSLITAVAVMILSRVPTENQELTALQIENLQLDIELKKRELAELELDALQSPEDLTTDTINDSIEVIKRDYKVTWRKSNIYKKINQYPKIRAIDVQRYFKESPVGDAREVLRDGFSSFILRTDELPELTVENVRIDVIAPAIKPGKFKWKGFYKNDNPFSLYKNDIIMFEMGDQEFAQKVQKGGVLHLSNDFSIEVNMIEKRKIDKDGVVKITNRLVQKVLAVYENGSRIEL